MSYKLLLVDGDKGDIAHVVINNNELKVVDVICQSCYKSVEVKKFNYSECKPFVCVQCKKESKKEQKGV